MKAGSFLHLVMFGYDFFEGEEVEYNGDSDDNSFSKASKYKASPKSTSVTRRRLRSLFDVIGSFRGISR